MRNTVERANARSLSMCTASKSRSVQSAEPIDARYTPHREWLSPTSTDCFPVSLANSATIALRSDSTLATATHPVLRHLGTNARTNSTKVFIHDLLLRTRQLNVRVNRLAILSNLNVISRAFQVSVRRTMIIGVNLKHRVARAEDRSRCTAAVFVMYQHRRVAGDHIVGVDGVDGEIAHPTAARTAGDPEDGDAAVDRAQVIAGR